MTIFFVKRPDALKPQYLGIGNTLAQQTGLALMRPRLGWSLQHAESNSRGTHSTEPIEP